MDNEALENSLSSATEGSRALDCEIALFLGWKRQSQELINQNTGDVETRDVWVLPGSGTVGKVLHYTSNLEHAMILAEQVSPSNVGACTWTANNASAQIGLASIRSDAATPALAICLAAIRFARTA